MYFNIKFHDVYLAWIKEFRDNITFNVCTVHWFYCLPLLLKQFINSFLNKILIYCPLHYIFVDVFLYFFLKNSLIYLLSVLQRELCPNCSRKLLWNGRPNKRIWWWLVISRNFSPNRLICGVVYDYFGIYIYIYIYTINSIKGMNHLKINESLILLGCESFLLHELKQNC